MGQIRLLRLSGNELLPYLDELGKLRIEVFFDFPYLYQGSLEYEKEYLKVYVEHPESFIVGLLDNQRWIGATTAIPLKAETASIQKPFAENGFELDTVFYFGESVLLPEYRGRGYGHLFFDEREQYALERGYTTTAFCSVIRPENHPLKPNAYQGNDAFWIKRSYTKRTEMTCKMSWKDRDEVAETEKELVFWTKEWK